MKINLPVDSIIFNIEIHGNNESIEIKEEAFARLMEYGIEAGFLEIEEDLEECFFYKPKG